MALTLLPHRFYGRDKLPGQRALLKKTHVAQDAAGAHEQDAEGDADCADEDNQRDLVGVHGVEASAERSRFELHSGLSQEISDAGGAVRPVKGVRKDGKQEKGEEKPRGSSN